MQIKLSIGLMYWRNYIICTLRLFIHLFWLKECNNMKQSLHTWYQQCVMLLRFMRLMPWIWILEVLAFTIMYLCIYVFKLIWLLQHPPFYYKNEKKNIWCTLKYDKSIFYVYSTWYTANTGLLLVDKRNVKLLNRLNFVKYFMWTFNKHLVSKNLLELLNSICWYPGLKWNGNNSIS